MDADLQSLHDRIRSVTRDRMVPELAEEQAVRRTICDHRELEEIIGALHNVIDVIIEFAEQLGVVLAMWNLCQEDIGTMVSGAMPEAYAVLREAVIADADKDATFPRALSRYESEKEEEVKKAETEEADNEETGEVDEEETEHLAEGWIRYTKS
jgi:hypothetical protein